MSTSKKTKSKNGHPHATTATTHRGRTASGASGGPAAASAQSPEPQTGSTESVAVPTSAAGASTGSGTLAAKIRQLIAVLEEVPTLLGAPGAPAAALSIQQRRALPKMKKGAEAEIPGVLALADKYKLTLLGGGTAEARADMDLVATLQPLEAGLTAAITLVGGVIAQATGRTWDTATMAYAMLARLQRRFPAIQTELDPMASFMATKHKSAPTILRQAESKTLSKSRSTRKANADKTDGTGTTAAAPALGAPTTVAAPPVAPSPPAPPPTATNGAGAAGPGANGGGVAAAENGVSHS